MRKVIGIDDSDSSKTIHEAKISNGELIFAKSDGKLSGVIVKDDDGWILRIGGSSGATGYYEERKDCLKSCLQYGYTFFVED